MLPHNQASNLRSFWLWGGLFGLCLLSPSAWGKTGPRPTQVFPDITNELRLSNRDTNWVRCDQPITDVHFSTEKNIQVQLKGKNGYIKFLITSDDQGKPVYQRNRSEFIFNCSGRMYKLLAYPRNVQSRTVLLTIGAAQKMKKNLQALAPLSEDDRIAFLVKQVWEGKLDEAWEVKALEKEIPLFETLNLTETRLIKIDGPGYQIREFQLQSKIKNLQLKETDFLSPKLSLSPLAVVVQPLVLDKGEKGRLLIVESVNRELGLPLVVGGEK